LKRQKYKNGWEFWIDFISYVNRNVDKWLREMGPDFYNDEKGIVQTTLDKFVGVERGEHASPAHKAEKPGGG